MAVTLSLGAAQLASGGDLTQIRDSGQSLKAGPSLYDVNRVAKTDRSNVTIRQQQGETVAVNLADQSILVQIPAARLGEARRNPSLLAPTGAGKRMVACEPVVSILTEVASRLQPGRCVT